NPTALVEFREATVFVVEKSRHEYRTGFGDCGSIDFGVFLSTTFLSKLFCSFRHDQQFLLRRNPSLLGGEFDAPRTQPQACIRYARASYFPTVERSTTRNTSGR